MADWRGTFGGRGRGSHEPPGGNGSYNKRKTHMYMAYSVRILVIMAREQHRECVVRGVPGLGDAHHAWGLGAMARKRAATARDTPCLDPNRDSIHVNRRHIRSLSRSDTLIISPDESPRVYTTKRIGGPSLAVDRDGEYDCGHARSGLAGLAGRAGARTAGMARTGSDS